LELSKELDDRVDGDRVGDEIVGNVLRRDRTAHFNLKKNIYGQIFFR
jgi:hypothetical protein